VLQRGIGNPEDRELAEDVLAETDRMSDILDDLLLTARLDAGKLSVDSKDFDLVPVILDAAERFGKRTTSRDLQLEIGELPGGLVARGDPARTAQILTVLLDNTIAHTPEGTGVTVLARAQDNLVEVLVGDEGAGIPAELREPPLYPGFVPLGPFHLGSTPGVWDRAASLTVFGGWRPPRT
jgi:signal transduction histidine kinase